MPVDPSDIRLVGDPEGMRAIAHRWDLRSGDLGAAAGGLERATSDLVFEGPAGRRYLSGLQDALGAVRARARDLDELAERMRHDATTVAERNEELLQQGSRPKPDRETPTKGEHGPKEEHGPKGAPGPPAGTPPVSDPDPAPPPAPAEPALGTPAPQPIPEVVPPPAAPPVADGPVLGDPTAMP